MKCPKCMRWIEEGSESHAVCGWNVAATRPAAASAPVHQAPLIPDAEVEASLERLGLARKPGESEAEHVAKVKLHMRRTIAQMMYREPNRDWAAAIERDWLEGRPVSYSTRKTAERALGREFSRDGQEGAR